MLVSIHQPEFVGYLGYYAKILQADKHIFLDNVQFIKRGFIQRNCIKRADKSEYINVPVKTKGRYTQLINQVEIDASFPWRKKLLRTLHSCYAKSPNYKCIYPKIEILINYDWQKIAELNYAWVKFFFNILDIKKDFSYASEFHIGGQKCERLCNLVKAVGGDAYLSGQGAAVYNDEEVFLQRKIKLEYCQFNHPNYNQIGEGFIKNLCVLDLLFNCSIGEIKKFLNI